MTDADTDGSGGDDAAGMPFDDTDDLGFDAPDGADATVVTQGDPIRSFVDLVRTALPIDEAKFRFTDDGLTVRVVDPPNVGMIDTTFDADGFTSYRAPADGLTVGMPLDTDAMGDLPSALAYARKGNHGQKGDPLRIDVYDGDESTRVRVAILRPDQQTKRVTEFYAIDPDMLRQEPELPDFDLPYRADPDIDALIDAVTTVDGDHAWLAADQRTFVLGTQPTRNPSLVGLDDDDVDLVDTVEFPNHAWDITDADGICDDVQGSLFSIQYLDGFARALKAGKATTATIKFGDEFPALIDFQNTDWGTSGTLMVAPRIPSEAD